jgi:DNA-binding transcriptional LysR family regulator
VNLTQVQVFLTLADELHFGRTAERVGLSQPRISRLVAALEREVGGAVFERTSRRVRLTPLGDRLRQGWQPAYDQLRAALDDARAAARQPEGTLRLGFTQTTGGTALTRLAGAFTARYPGCRLTLHEVGIGDPYQALRRGDIDVLVNWLAVDEPDLSAGPAIDHQPRVLAVASSHPLARHASVSAEILADYPALATPPGHRFLYDTLVPPVTPAGRPVRRTVAAESLNEGLALVAAGQAIHPTVASVPLVQRSDITLVPIIGLPALPLGLIWCTAHENTRVRNLAALAADL